MYKAAIYRFGDSRVAASAIFFPLKYKPLSRGGMFMGWCLWGPGKREEWENKNTLKFQQNKVELLYTCWCLCKLDLLAYVIFFFLPQITLATPVQRGSQVQRSLEFVR